MVKNSLDLTLAPRLKHTEVEDLDLTNLMLFIQSADKSKLLPPSAEMANFVTKKVLGKDSPETSKEDYDKYLMRSKTIYNDSFDKPNAQQFNDVVDETT